ncbi:hypothetical protein FOL47_010340 [Perkinsus chesapeaki]|uniref:tRNA-splicing endonuclease subunit Sen54 N-terminal domain-containing protein n=1 Tax=Perkinsus chesapeaki TaxID=330153 RepID=A0A7J6L4E8_PERCH|nr:hypothetical protein FOL47_010340 [Perkinsus chesapeaki]
MSSISSTECDSKRGTVVGTEEWLRTQEKLQREGECEGKWNAEECKVTITVRSGKSLQTIAPGRAELNLEESLYLAERGSLVVSGMTVGELWRVLESLGQEAVDGYIVYANLKRAGYEVYRGEKGEGGGPPLRFTVRTPDTAAVRESFEVIVVSSAYSIFGEETTGGSGGKAVIAVVEMGAVVYLSAEWGTEPPVPTIDGAISKRLRSS